MIRVRPVASEDAPAVVGIMTAAFEAQFGEAWGEGQILNALAHPNTLSEVALFSGRIVGFSLVRVIADEAELLLVAVAPEARRLGIGRTLVESAACTARAQGGKALYLEVRDGNAAASELYRNSGFTEVGRRSGYYAGANQARYDAITMRREL